MASGRMKFILSVPVSSSFFPISHNQLVSSSFSSKPHLWLTNRNGSIALPSTGDKWTPSFLRPLRAENRWAWRKSWHQEFKERICVVSLPFKLITGESYFKLQKASRTLPEFLQRHGSIDRNNQEEPTGLLYTT